MFVFPLLALKVKDLLCSNEILLEPPRGFELRTYALREGRFSNIEFKFLRWSFTRFAGFHCSPIKFALKPRYCIA